MDEKLSIEQVMKIMDWSYPTARVFAVQNGLQNASGKWFVPAQSVWDLVWKHQEKADNIKERFFAEMPNFSLEPA